MANNGGMLQALITAPSDYQISITEVGGGGGPNVVTAFPDTSTAYLSGTTGLLKTAGDAITDDATLQGTYTFSLDSTTGKVTLTATGITSFTIVWTTTALRDLLGFSGSESGTLSYESDGAAKALWIPNCPVQSPFGIDDEGWYEYDSASTQAPDGTVVATAYNRRTVLQLDWMAVAKARSRIADETVSNQSWQQFYDDCIYGAQEWATTGGPVGWFPDRTDGNTKTVYKIPVQPRSTHARMQESWDGLYSISIPRMVKVPS